jgi:hypothetical protein
MGLECLSIPLRESARKTKVSTIAEIVSVIGRMLRGRVRIEKSSSRPHSCRKYQFGYGEIWMM